MCLILLTGSVCLKQEVVQSQVLEAKVFHSPYGTGVAIVTGSSRFTLATNIEDLKLRRLPEVPGKDGLRTAHPGVLFPSPTCFCPLRSPGPSVLLGRPHSGQTDQSPGVQWT